MAAPSIPIRARCRRSERGFTLIELFVSLFVFTVGMAGVFALQAAIIKNNSMSSDISLASNLAAAALEQLRITKYQDIAGGSACPALDPNNAGAVATAELANEVCRFDKQGQIASAANTYFTRTWEAAHNPQLDVKDVTVTVKWSFRVLPEAVATDMTKVTMTGRVFPR